MGLLGKIMNKVGEKMESVMSKNLTGESKEAYQREQKEKEEIKKVKEDQVQSQKEELELHSISAIKSDLKNLEDLLTKIKVLDNKNFWVGGFENYKLKQNARFSNLFFGNKNIRVLSLIGDTFYVSKFNGSKFYAYGSFTKSDVSEVKIEGMFFKKLKIIFNGKKIFTIDVSKNKNKLKDLKDLLKK